MPDADDKKPAAPDEDQLPREQHAATADYGTRDDSDDVPLTTDEDQQDDDSVISPTSS